MSGKQMLSAHSLMRSFRGNAADQAAIQQVLDCTGELVECALRADWRGVLDIMDQRRRLLRQVIDSDVGHSNPEVAALTSAVEESERALMRVIAHAIASSRWSGAAFMIYH